MESKITKEFAAKALSAFQKYKSDKESLNQRVRENDYWYKARYGRLINPSTSETEPSTAFIFSAIENKFSDAIDNFPMPNILEREPEDKELSDILSKIVPVQLDISDFKKAYKTNWRRKLKHGTGIYGVFYKNGEIKISSVSLLNVYCDMHVGNVQDSQFLFIVNAVDNEELKKTYPQHTEKFCGNATVEGFDGTHEIDDRTEIVDCYYKKDGKLHCIKFCNSEIVEATEDGDYPDGIYSHGMYPVVFDVLYPEEDSPFGFGVIDIAKNPQAYIDRMDGAIIKNAILSSKIRFLIKDSGAVNEEEVLDYSNDIIHVAGSVENDSIRELQVSGLPAYVMSHRSKKIDELKEVVGNRDFQQGNTARGVVAASAITALQESGNKLSRSSIDDAFDRYKEIVLMVIELMREFFEDKHIYRITGDAGNAEFAEFTSDMMYKKSSLPESWNRKEPIRFDVEIVPQKQNPFQREVNNNTIIQLWQTGFFKPEFSDSALIAMEAMSFDGKEKIIDSIKKRKNFPGDELVPIEETVEKLKERNNQNEQFRNSKT